MGHRWDLDVYAGDLAGLVIAEVEINDETITIDTPPFVIREVTFDGRFKNRALSESVQGLAELLADAT